VSKLFVQASYTMATKGFEYAYTGVYSDPVGNGLGLPFLSRTYWEMNEMSLLARYQVLNDAWLFVGISSSEHKGIMRDVYSMPNMAGKQTTINVGANVGF